MYVGYSAEDQINISGTMADNLNEKAAKGGEAITIDMFNNAERVVLNVMERDTFARFKDSVAFDDYLYHKETTKRHPLRMDTAFREDLMRADTQMSRPSNRTISTMASAAPHGSGSSLPSVPTKGGNAAFVD